MDNINLNLSSATKIADEFPNNINLEDLGLILKKAIKEIENGTSGKNGYEALDEIELEVFGDLLRNQS